MGKKSRTEVISFGPLDPVPEEISRVLALDTRVNKEIDMLVRRRFWDEEPMTVEHVAICHEYVAGLKPHDFEGSLFALLEKRVAIAYSHQEVEAMLMDKKNGQTVAWQKRRSVVARSFGHLYGRCQANSIRHVVLSSR